MSFPQAFLGSPKMQLLLLQIGVAWVFKIFKGHEQA
jgi:hypothetical protein